MKRYPNYKESGVEWLKEVPEHWSVKRLCFVADMNPSKSEVAHFDRALPISFLPMEAIGDDGSLDLERQKPVDEVENGYTYFRDGDVTVAKITPCFENGKGAMMRGLLNGVGFGTTELIVARPRPGQITSEYLHAIFRSTEFLALGEAQMYGAGGQKRVPESFVRNFATGFPPIAEQIAIAAFLDRETAKIDGLVGEQRRLIELLKEKRQAVISHAVTKGLNPHAKLKPSGIEWLGDVPEHWVVKSLSMASKRIAVGLATSVTDYYRDEGVAIIRNQNIKEGFFDGSEMLYLDKKFADAESSKVVRRNDVIVVRTGSNLGLACVVPDAHDNCHTFTTLIVTPEDDLDSPYLTYCLNSEYGKAEMCRLKLGFGKDNLNVGEFKKFVIILPPRAEQRLMTAHLDHATTKYDALTAEAERAIGLLQERRTALISAAVTGKIDVRGISDGEAA